MSEHKNHEVTRILAEWIARAGTDERTADASTLPLPIPASAIRWAQHALLDWLAVTVAACDEPLVRMLVDEYAGPPGSPALLVGLGATARVQDAALINGAAGHALDYDDVATRMIGHPSVPVIPAALALAQSANSTGVDLLRALVVGHEIESRIGDLIGADHYRQGFHPTGTIGTLGAAAACATLRRLDAGRTVHALGLAATQAAGLKSMFGTMAKPLHAGKAAMNGLMAVQLAARGFTAGSDAVECFQGFLRTLSPGQASFEPTMDTSRGFAIESALFKYHAACYLTHSGIEAVRQLRETHRLSLQDLESMRISVHANHRGVCDIAEPASGLALKFSLQQLAVLALDGADTAALDLYQDGIVREPTQVEARRRVALRFVEADDTDTATVELLTRDGRRLVHAASVAIPATDLDDQWQRLARKARAIAQPKLGAERFERMVDAVRTLNTAPTLDTLCETLR